MMPEKRYPVGEEPIGEPRPSTADDPVPIERQGVLYKGGYFARDLQEHELPVFREMYATFKKAYPDLDACADDALLIEMLKKLIYLQREKPPKPPSEQGEGKKSNGYDYEVARSKLVVTFMDALGLNRKQRKERETAADIEKALSKFFTQDGRTRDKTGGRTLAKTAAPVLVDGIEAERAAREAEKWRSTD